MVRPELQPVAQSRVLMLEREIQWFEAHLEYVFHQYFDKEPKAKPEVPTINAGDSEFAKLLVENQADNIDRLIIMLALMPHIKPQSLDAFFIKNSDFDRGFSEFGGITSKQHSGFIPTVETALWLLGEDKILLRLSELHRFNNDHWFFKKSVIELNDHEGRDPLNARALTVNSAFVDLCTLGYERAPSFSSSFPAQLLETQLDWDDLVLDAYTHEQLIELQAWLNHNQTMMDEWNLSGRIKNGYRCLFYGPPGTGKTLTATLIGKKFQRQVYRIDLSMVVSKYIGETEKNLEKVFQQGENKDWILFFDEADAIFGKRTNVNDSHDRFANQEISYLLQRVEDYPRLVILATNLKANVDEAFSRRFQAMIHFPMPTKAERLKLWTNGLAGIKLDKSVDLKEISQSYELSGGSIVNVVRYAVLLAIHNERKYIVHNDIAKGIQRELVKEGKSY